jgi:Putative peptidoglycan binding domain
MRKVAVLSTLILLLGLASPSYAHGSWGGGGGWHGGGGWGWRGGGCCWGGWSVGYGGYPYYPYPYGPYGYSPYPYPYAPYPASPAPASYSSTVTRAAPGAGSTVDAATVRAIQSELQTAGYNVGGIDGRLGPKTKAAIRQYEQKNGLPVDGSPSRALLDHLRSQSTG